MYEHVGTQTETSHYSSTAVQYPAKERTGNEKWA